MAYKLQNNSVDSESPDLEPFKVSVVNLKAKSVLVSTIERRIKLNYFVRIYTFIPKTNEFLNYITTNCDI